MCIQGFGEKTGEQRPPGVYGLILKMDLNEMKWGGGAVLIWARTGTGGGLL